MQVAAFLEHRWIGQHSDARLNPSPPLMRQLVDHFMHAVVVIVKSSARPAAMSACGCLLAFTSVSAHAIESIDEPLLRLERVQHFYAQMASAAQLDRPFLEVAEDRPRSAVRARGIEMAKDVYSVERAMADIRSKMRAVSGASPAAGTLPEIVTRIDNIDSFIDGKSFEELQAIRQAWTKRYQARPDRRKIDAIIATMVAPDLAGETVVTARRVKWVYETLIVERPARLDAIDAAELSAGIEVIMTRTRGPDHDGQPPLLRRDDTQRMWKERRQVVLAQLPLEDVAKLHQIYAMSTARAKINVLKAAFRSRNDADGLHFMTKMIGEGRTR
ncbi:MAG: hypothetical protein EOP20_02325 [Hyphomicrobiales bacterium]|nr:MAG: hypothetical protein EOP20_02325 [Hyphomicrobiales bacterium]